MRGPDMTAAQAHEIWSAAAMAYIDDFPDRGLLPEYDQLDAQERFLALASIRALREAASGQLSGQRS
jgi:hypothetical protein